MFARWRAAGLLIPAFMTLALLPVLIGLGTWQLQRKAWKEDLIQKIEARTKAEPVSLAEALGRSADPQQIEYLRVRATGTFDHNVERHVYAPRTQGQGWHVYTLFRPDGDAPALFVNRGWVPDDKKLPTAREQGQVAGPVTVTGLLRAPETKSTFTPDNDVTGNRWYSRDLAGMQASASGSAPASSAQVQRLAPFSLDAEAEPANPGGWPRGGTTVVHIFNSHLQYVVTWYGLALTLIAVFIAFARQRLAALDNPPSNP